MTPGTQTIQSVCKFCHQPVTLEIDEQCTSDWLDKLLPLAACNRCADFKRKKYNLTDKIIHECIQLLRNRMGVKTEDDTGKLFDNITEFSKQFSMLICSYYRIGSYLQNILIDQLTESPGKVEETLGIYCKLVWKEARKDKTNPQPAS